MYQRAIALARTVVAVAALALPLGAVAQTSRPQPEGATTRILRELGTADVIAVDAAHGNKILDDYLLTLIESSEFRRRIDDIVVECGNSKFQSLLDRYIGGEAVPDSVGLAAWMSTGLGMCAVSRFYERLFPLVRRLNAEMPDHRVRVLVTEPPVDWTANPSDIATARRGNRDSCIAAVMEAEVLGRHHKALMLFGSEHLQHNQRSSGAVSRYEQRYPNKTFVIHAHDGFVNFMGLPRAAELEARMASWPRPSIVPIRDTWLADLDLPYFMWPFPKGKVGAGEVYADEIDALLYLGPGDSLTLEPPSHASTIDSASMSVFRQRLGVRPPSNIEGTPLRPLISQRDIAEARTFLPGAPLVGTWVDSTGRWSADIDYANGKLALRPANTTTWSELVAESADRFRVTLAGASVPVIFEMAGSQPVSVTIGEHPGLRRRR